MAKFLGARQMGLAVAAIGGLAIGGCATSSPSVEVTRFHAPGAIVQSGTILVQAQPGPPDDSIEYRTFASAVAQELQRVGFTDAGGRQAAGSSDYVALIAYDREVRSPNDANGGRSPVSVGVGGGTGGFGSGLGVGIGINLSGKPKDVVFTRLSVQIRRKSDYQSIWEGRAETSGKVGTPAAQANLAAGKLANALFKGYPGKSGETISVK